MINVTFFFILLEQFFSLQYTILTKLIRQRHNQQIFKRNQGAQIIN